MNLWIVILVASQIAGTVGPLPYGIDECLLRVAKHNGELSDDIRLSCRWSVERPTTTGEFAGTNEIVIDPSELKGDQ